MHFLTKYLFGTVIPLELGKEGVGSIKKIDLFNRVEGADKEVFDDIIKYALERDDISDDTELTFLDITNIGIVLDEEYIYEVVDDLAKKDNLELWQWYERDLEKRIKFVNEYVEKFGTRVGKFGLLYVLQKAHEEYIFYQAVELYAAIDKLTDEYTEF